MLKRSLVVSLVMVLMLACIHVVVNVYFPESEAKGALASLEDELLQGSPAKPQPPAEEPAPPSPSPSSNLNPAKIPGGLTRWISPQVAYAAGPISEEAIYNKIKSMPQVVEAYERIAARLPRVNELRKSGLAGEGRNGLLVARGNITNRKDQRTLDEENADRSVVIKGLAKATLLAQGLAVSPENLNQVMDDAGATFAALRRDKAHPGWWIQMADGTWKKK
jgi:hypothetical protein